MAGHTAHTIGIYNERAEKVIVAGKAIKTEQALDAFICPSSLNVKKCHCQFSFSIHGEMMKEKFP